MATAGPPAYAWDWFARQRLLWRESRSRLVQATQPVAARYRELETRADVMALLRADYPRDEAIRATVDAVVTELTFLGRVDRRFVDLGLRNSPRGMRWWWTTLTGEDLEHATNAEPTSPQRPLQLSLSGFESPETEVRDGYGDTLFDHG